LPRHGERLKEIGEMTATGVPDENARLRALARYVVLDTPRERDFDDLAEIARAVTGCPIAGIALVDAERVWFKALTGWDLRQCARSEFFPAHKGDRGLLVVRDARNDECFGGLPAVTGPPHVRFYAGVPLTTSDGYFLGSLFVVDKHPRDLAEGQLFALGALARQVVALLELRRTLTSYHRVVDGAGHVVCHLDEDDRLLSVTPMWSQLTGYGVVRSLGQRLRDFVHPDDRDRFEEQLPKLHQEAAPPPMECRLVRLVGDDIPVELVARPLLDEGKRRLGIVGVIADISERKAREIENQHAQRMEALGRLSAGIAHEINTPIQFVGDNTRFLAESYETMLKLLLAYREVLDIDTGNLSWAERWEILQRAEKDADVAYLTAEVPSAVRQSLDGVERVASLVRAMKTFSHPGHAEQAPADINEALTATVTVARNQIKYVADVVLDLGELPPVICEIGDLNQVFLNMIVNAADAIEETGKHGEIKVVSRVDGDSVVIAITDSGKGVPESMRLKIFEPFFTTKDVGRGTGQGLALARAVVQDKHAGFVSVDSEVGVGSTFTIRIPISGRAGRGMQS